MIGACPGESGNETDTVPDVNMDLPYVRLIEELRGGRSGAQVDAPLREALAYDGLRDARKRITRVSVAGRIAHPLHVALERPASATPRLRVRWSHWKTDRPALSGRLAVAPTTS